MRLAIRANDKTKQANFLYELDLSDTTILKMTALTCATATVIAIVCALADEG